MEIDQQFGECWFNLGNALRKGMNPAGAEAAFLQALKINNTLFGAAVGLGQALSEQENTPKPSMSSNKSSPKSKMTQIFIPTLVTP